jgi:hypothetical protein
MLPASFLRRPTFEGEVNARADSLGRCKEKRVSADRNRRLSFCEPTPAPASQENFYRRSSIAPTEYWCKAAW